MIIPLLYYLTMVLWMPRNALERCQFMLGLSIFTVLGPFINIGVTLYAVKNMDNFGWGKTRKVVAETGEAEEPDADEQQKRTQDALANDEKVIGSRAPDEENQLGRAATPYTAEPPKLRRVKGLVGTTSELRRSSDNNSILHGAPKPRPLLPRKCIHTGPGGPPRETDGAASSQFGARASTSSNSSNNSSLSSASGPSLHRPRRVVRASTSRGDRRSSEDPFEVRSLNLNRTRYSDHSLNFRAEDFRSR
jgi:hypothetical protein